MADTDNYPGPAARPGGKGAGGTIALVAAVLLVVFGVWWFKTSSSTSGPSAVHKGLPRLVDLGGENCNECKKMAPILAELKDQYVGRMDVQFIDVWKDPKAGEEYGIRIIPTQIFYDASGKERFRNEGFLSKADILRKWKELGVELSAPPPQ